MATTGARRGGPGWLRGLAKQASPLRRISSSKRISSLRSIASAETKPRAPAAARAADRACAEELGVGVASAGRWPAGLRLERPPDAASASPSRTSCASADHTLFELSRRDGGWSPWPHVFFGVSQSSAAGMTRTAATMHATSPAAAARPKVTMAWFMDSVSARYPRVVVIEQSTTAPPVSTITSTHVLRTRRGGRAA